MCLSPTRSYSINSYMSSNIVSLGFLVSQNCTLMDFLPGADTMASRSKFMLMRSGHVLKRILVSDFLSPMKSQIAFGSADIEAIEGGVQCPHFAATSASTTPARKRRTPVASDSGFTLLSPLPSLYRFSRRPAHAGTG